MSDLTGKVAVITGGNSGIGLATAQELKNRGATVAITGRSAESLRAAASQLGGNTLSFQGDVTDHDHLEKVFTEVAAKLGKIDILFVNAGVAKFAPLEGVTADFFDEIMNINFRGAFFSVQQALPCLNDGASIVLNTSINAHIGMPNSSVYAASKAALISLVRTLSAELVGRGIRVNAVSPGPVATPIYERLGMPAADLQTFAAGVAGQIPLGRFGRPEEIAKTVAFLASPDSSFIVGSEIIADGGMSQL